MRTIGVGIALLAVVGCGHSCTSTGWEFRVGKPPSIVTPALINQLPGPSVVAPVSAFPVSAAQTSRVEFAESLAMPRAVPVAPKSYAPMTSGARPELKGGPDWDCTLEEVCDRVKALEKRLFVGPMPQRMP